jgi:hypothetical protein
MLFLRPSRADSAKVLSISLQTYTNILKEFEGNGTSSAPSNSTESI